MKNLKIFKNAELKKLDVFVGGELPGDSKTYSKACQTKETQNDKDANGASDRDVQS